MALIVHESVWQELLETFRLVTANHPATVPALTRLSQRDITSALRYSVELHAVDVYQGHGEFEGVPREDREKLIADVLDIVAGDQERMGRDRLALVWSAVKKAGGPWGGPTQLTPGGLAFVHTAGLCQTYLEAYGADARGMFVADETPGGEEVMQDYLRLFQDCPRDDVGAPTFEAFPARLIEAIHFVDSRRSPFIQMADFCAYFTGRALRRHTLADDPYCARFARRLVVTEIWPPETT